MKGKKIGEDKYSEQWSLGGHSSVWVPKWVVEQVREDEQDRIVKELRKEADNWKEDISYITIEGIVTDWRDYEKVYHEDTPPITNNKN